MRGITRGSISRSNERTSWLLVRSLQISGVTWAEAPSYHWVAMMISDGKASWLTVSR
jgi:hypothetical protein